MRNNYTKEDIIQIVEEEDIEFIRLQFTDIFGNLKNIAITSSQLIKALNNRCMFDGSCIYGYIRLEESDMYLYPDLDTLEIFPWRPQHGKVARMICDVYTPDGKPFEGDSRYVLKRAIKEAEQMGYTFDVGPECEFFLFHTDENGMPTTISHEQAGYFAMGTSDFGENVRRDMILTLEDMGFVVESSHHEVAPAQHEIDFQYGEALETADNIMTFKLAVKTIAKRHGLHATFMPKPKSGVDGSGMHINMSLSKDGKNVFTDETDECGLSKEAYYFMGGIMKHIGEMTAVLNPLVNSYKRLVPGYEAPVYVTWSNKNKNPLIRVPSSRDTGSRIELRSPDPAANPYLALALCLRAGLDGIKNQIMPPERVNYNMYELTQQEKKEKNVESLPSSLTIAIDAMEESEFVKDVLGEMVFTKYIEAKRKEWDAYRTQVSDWEVDQYLNQY